MSTQKKALLALAVMAFVMLMQGLTNTVMAYIMRDYAELGPLTVRQIMALPNLIAVFVAVLVGPIALKVNKKFLLVLCGVAALFYFMTFAIVGSNGPFIWLLAAACVYGFNLGAGLALISSIMAEHVGPDKRAKYIAICTAMMTAGGIFSSQLGGIIAAANDGANWNYAYWLGLIIIPATLFFIFMLPKKPEGAPAGGPGGPSGPGGSGGDEPAKFPLKMLLVTLFQVLFSISFATYLFNFSAYIIMEFQLGTSAHAGTVQTSFQIAGVVVALTYGVWAKVFKKWVPVAGTVALIIAMLSILTLNTSLAGIFIGAILIGFAVNVVRPFVIAHAISITPRKLVPIAMSLLLGGVNIGQYFALYVHGLFAPMFGGGVMGAFRTGLAGAVLATIFGLFLFTLSKVPMAVPPRGGPPKAPAEDKAQ